MLIKAMNSLLIFRATKIAQIIVLGSKGSNRSGGNQENELHGIGWNHYEQAVVIDFIANNSE
jgi:hypothetical protein